MITTSDHVLITDTLASVDRLFGNDRVRKIARAISVSGCSHQPVDGKTKAQRWSIGGRVPGPRNESYCVTSKNEFVRYTPRPHLMWSSAEPKVEARKAFFVDTTDNMHGYQFRSANYNFRHFSYQLPMSSCGHNTAHDFHYQNRPERNLVIHYRIDLPFNSG